ncbi:BMC domain-containing protein [Salipaludibacillus daqingensis]|uniref:BMC domain-containing protein n=1 Tax=Salipaludibacillus daqingensis TaxID=3041001 RepID=UPI0024750373|nr:BMC domain-containing protein [Salipaludibacillus daqingensis]
MKALGLIETVGMTAALEAADAAVKSANVRIIGYERAKGGGLITVKFDGDVGAVQSALQAAEIAASKINTVFSKHMISRPNEEIKSMIFPKNEPIAVSDDRTPKASEGKEPEIAGDDEKDTTSDADEEGVSEENDSKSLESNEKKEVQGYEEESILNMKAECNLCGDPKCPRNKGELRSMCLHYQEIGGENNG